MNAWLVIFCRACRNYETEFCTYLPLWPPKLELIVLQGGAPRAVLLYVALTIQSHVELPRQVCCEPIIETREVGSSWGTVATIVAQHVEQKGFGVSTLSSIAKQDIAVVPLAAILGEVLADLRAWRSVFINVINQGR